MPRIGINAAFLRQPGTGIGEMTRHFLHTLIEVSRKDANFARAEFLLYLQEDIDWVLPENFAKKVVPPPYKRDDLVRKIWWERLTLPRAAARDGCEKFVSLYQSATVLPQIPHLMVVHDIIPEIFPQYLNNSRKKVDWFFVRRAVRQADKVLTISENSRRDLLEHWRLDTKKVSVSPIDCAPIFKQPLSQSQTAEVLRRYGLSDGEYIYFGGGMDLRKNVERLLQAYKDLHANYAEKIQIPPLAISGKLQPQLAPLWTDVEKLAKDLKLEKSVQILGFVPDQDLPHLYAGAKFFVYPSLYEGFGLPVLEALSVGAPVAASRASSIPEVAGEAALYFNPQSVPDITEAMKKLLTDNALRQNLAARGPSQAAKFDWAKFVRTTLDKVL